MITKVEFGLLMHVELMKEDSESHVSHNLKAQTSCDRQTNVTRLNFSTPLVGRCKLFTILFLSVTKTEFQNRNLSRQVMRIKKISVRGLIVDSIKILQTDIIRIVWRTIGIIAAEILGVTGLRHHVTGVMKQMQMLL